MSSARWRSGLLDRAPESSRTRPERKCVAAVDHRHQRVRDMIGAPRLDGRRLGDAYQRDHVSTSAARSRSTPTRYRIRMNAMHKSENATNADRNVVSMSPGSDGSLGLSTIGIG